ncbi:hypothetical protein [Streptomyces antarcticus]|uniref:hypothetical protein n=1 Tax=Streptomyces antarcticus TaxID=2996458 RepID=UPI00226D47FF|nr:MULTISPECIES: hypothetical protein [unclassified Streptomyces]MCY0942617.1 hypothetical protein [Streptomyces sp. H34-AA3]MCZ4081363.1 hypothetical protein [Streptomyces sp. H34-S5]
MSSSKASSAPVLYSPDLEPVPVPGCMICGAAGRHRDAIRRLGNVVGVHAMNVVIGEHPHRQATDEQGVTA